MNLASLVLKKNYFMFENNHYMQNEGMAKGSSLSSILLELFLNQIEYQHLWSDLNHNRNKLIHYSRYVDETLVLFNDNERQITLLCTYLNSNSFYFKISSHGHFSSHHPYHHKTAAYNSFVHRLLSITLSPQN